MKQRAPLILVQNPQASLQSFTHCCKKSPGVHVILCYDLSPFCYCFETNSRFFGCCIDSTIMRVALQPDGKIVAVGWAMSLNNHFALARYLRDSAGNPTPTPTSTPEPSPTPTPAALVLNARTVRTWQAAASHREATNWSKPKCRSARVTPSSQSC
jgi:hypothetical protein